MSNTRNNLMIAVRACVPLLCAMFIVAPARGQAPNRPTARTQALGGRAKFAFSWPLVPGTSLVTPSGVTPAAGGPALPVIGGGTLGRLTKWTGFTGSNSVIGDTTIFEDKFGNVGIGTDSPTSKLTVAGTIQASGGTSILHDATLQGSGTSASPLGVALPLTLNGSGDFAIIQAINTSDGGNGVFATAGDSNTSFGGSGIVGHGGNSTVNTGGLGVLAFGGFGTIGGDGVFGEGGFGSTNGNGGNGVSAKGGNSLAGGGDGVSAKGGTGSGAGNRGGNGITASAGHGVNGATDGLAGKFNGDVQVTGNLSKGGGSFKIDHPLDPENKYLYHSFVESPDMKNIYDGTVTTDQNGDATITLPDYFGALNRDFRYQLTVIGTFAQAIVSGEIENNQFRIRTSAPGVKVSWQVTGIRQDAYANRHRIPVEELKSDLERGSYLHPDVFNLPEEKNVLFVQRPLLMKHERVLREAATGRQK